MSLSKPLKRVKYWNYTEQEKKQIVEAAIPLRESGKSITATAEILGINPGTLQSWLHKSGVKHPKVRSKASSNNLSSWKKSNVGYQDGELNPNWKGGNSRSTMYREVKRKSNELGLNQYICEDCFTQSDTRLNIHHANGNKKDNTTENLIALCPACHSKRHPKGRDESGRFI
jgi:IS30 family transposase